MNEMNRTAVFAAIAVILSAITYATMPTIEKQSPAQKVGKSLFPKFEDPLEATSLEVVKYDKETATANTFKVAKVGTSWVIPSHSDYPADAENQLADVAAEWIDLEVLGVATDPAESGIESNDIRGLHKLYGVVDPAEEDTSDAEGVGIRVVMRNKSDEELVRLIIGKEVEDQPELRYVRLIGQDPVYTVKANTRKLSTKFEDWIEDDLLKLSSWDIRKVAIEDYSIDVLQGFITPRGQISLEYNDTGDPRWKMPVDREYSKDGWADRGLAENEELNTDTLNNLKSALDDLKIVDVLRKPKGLSETLKSSGQLSLDHEAEQSLSRAGFYVVPVQDPKDPSKKYYDLRSNEGEISVAMKTGVQYVLRFGQIAGMGSGEAKDEQKKEGESEEAADEADKSTEGNVNRYLFVMAQLDKGMIEEPKYEELPELPPEQPEKEEPKADAKKSDANDASKDAGAEKSEGEKAAEGDSKDASEENAKAGGDSEKASGAEGDKQEPKAEEAAKPTREEIEKQREKIKEDNERKKDEYEQKIKDAEEKVADLNARFADWYYIIDNSEYQKIHLSRDKIVKEKEKKEEEGKDKESASDASPQKPAAKPDSIGEFESLKEEAPAEK